MSTEALHEDRFQHLRETLKNLPGLPGVYRMVGQSAESEEQVLYVGKARDLKKRVGSYFLKNNHSPRISMMVAMVKRIDTTVTRSEAEALILENNLIKTLEPRYNILFRDDKSYPYLLISKHSYPQLRYFRGKPDKQHQVFGPYPSAFAVREGINLLQKTFQLRTCDNSVFSHRSRPCMLHQIERCSAPCVGAVTEEAYAQDVQDASMFLAGKGETVVQQLNSDMLAAAQALAFEQAAVLRNKITRLRSLQQKQFVSSVGEHDVDVVAVVIEQGLVAVNLVMVRAGQHVGDKTFFPTHTKSMLKEVGDDKLAAEAAEAEVLMGFCAHHYLSQSVPPLILLNHRFEWEALEEVLTAQRGGKVVLQAHSTQEKKVWQQMALHNAHLAITQKLAQEATQEHRLQALIEALELPVETARLECFDISHTQGEATVASCVVFDNNALQSSQYRRFNVQPAVGGDDYAAMREALSRRCARIAAEEIPRPDVIIIDGGKGQVGVAAQVLEEHGLSDIIMFGSAKGVERKKGQEQIIFPGRELPLRLGENHPGLHLIQTLQDEAHRFAIQSHRARRAKVRTQSALQEIDGVGPKRRQDLLKHFGGIVGVEKAGVDDLMRVKGISKELALRIYSAMH